MSGDRSRKPQSRRSIPCAVRRAWTVYSGADGVASRFAFVTAEIVEDDRRHVGLDPRLIDKNQARSDNPALMGLPAKPFTGDVEAILFGRLKRFFEAQPFGMNKSPDRPDVCL